MLPGSSAVQPLRVVSFCVHAAQKGTGAVTPRRPRRMSPQLGCKATPRACYAELLALHALLTAGCSKRKGATLALQAFLCVSAAAQWLALLLAVSLVHHSEQSAQHRAVAPIPS